MGLLNLFGLIKRGRPADDDDHWYSPFITDNATGVAVTPETAAGTAAGYACVTAIAQTIATMPLITFERTKNESRERAVNSPYYKLFKTAPNSWMCAGEWIEMMLVHLLLRGNSYNYKLKDRAGRVEMILPLNPTKMEVQQLSDRTIVYKYTSRPGDVFYIQQEDILHVKTGFSDGLVGRSPISVARETMGITQSSESFAGRFFKNSAKPAGTLTHPGKLSKEASERIKASWQAANGGTDNEWKVAVIEEGMKFEPISMSASDSQFLEQRKFQLEEVARLFRVPPHIVGDLSRATFSNIEHQSINYVVFCLQYYMKRIEQTMEMNFFPTLINGKDYYVEFLADSLLRGDTKSRNESYEIQRRNGTLSANEWRRLENMPLIADPSADKYLVPLNMTWLEDLGKNPPQQDKPVSKVNDVSEEEDSVDEEAPAIEEKQMQLARSSFSGILSRLIYKEEEALSRLRKKENADLKIADWMTDHETTCRSVLMPHLEVYGYFCGRGAGRCYDDKLVDLAWSGFWKQYKTEFKGSSEERTALLANSACELMESIFGASQKLLAKESHEESRAT